MKCLCIKSVKDFTSGEIYDLNIRVHQYEDKTEKNMTLSGKHEINETIFDQIKEQKLYN